MSSNRRKSINSWAQPPPPVLQPQNTAVPSVSARNRTRSAQTTFTPAVGQGTALDPPATGWGRVPVNAGASAVLPIRNAGREPLPPRRDHSRVRSVSVTGTEVYQFRKSILKPQTPAPTQPPQKPSGGAPTAYIEPPVIPGITVPAPEPVKSNDPRWNPYIYKGAGHRFSRTSPYAIEFEGKSYKSSEELFKHMMVSRERRCEAEILLNRDSFRIFRGFRGCGPTQTVTQKRVIRRRPSEWYLPFTYALAEYHC